MPLRPDPRRPVHNRLLAALPPEDYGRVRPHLEPITFALGDLVYDSGGPQDSLYFPTTAVVSLLYTMEDGSTAEMGLTGNDGVVGIALFLGGATTPNRAVAQIAGGALRIPANGCKQSSHREAPQTPPNYVVVPIPAVR
jgi:hypothetical protein